MKCQLNIKYYYFSQSTFRFVIYNITICSTRLMYKIFAGTAFGQVIQIDFHNKKKNIKRLGNMKKQKILDIKFQPNQKVVYYSSNQQIYQYDLKTSVQQKIAQTYQSCNKIVNFNLYQKNLVYGLNNGSIVSIKEDKQKLNLLTQEIKGEGQYKKFIYNNADLFLMVGKNVLPFVYDINKIVVNWRGKNVSNDQLDLKVPINDIDALFFNQKNIACANSDNKVRLYDVRGNKTKPYQDIHLKLEKTYSKTFLTKMVCSSDSNYFYLGNSVGSIYQCDFRKNLGVIGKFKGISTSITDLSIVGQSLYSTSLDCYVRKFNIQTKVEEQKYYTNKALHCLNVLKDLKGQQQFAQEEMALDQNQIQQDESKKKALKMKQMRKRNKVGLKYLEPVNWDEVQLKFQHQQQYEVKSQEQELNSKDQFEQQLQLKNEDEDLEDSD